MALPVSPALALPISLDGFRVGLPVLARIIGIAVAPFLLAVPADLVVLGVGVERATVIFPASLPLAIGAAAHKLVRVITARSKDLLAVATMAITHRRLQIGMRAVYCECMTSHGSERANQNEDADLDQE